VAEAQAKRVSRGKAKRNGKKGMRTRFPASGVARVSAK